MKHKYLSALLLMVAICAQAASITFTMTNNLGQPDTNRIKVFPIASYINSDGSVQTTGLPFWLQPNTSGQVATNLNQGNYLATNSFICSQYVGPGQAGTGQGIIFAVPAGSGSYSLGQLAISGYNVYNYNGAAFVATASNIFSAIGYIPLTPQQTTNLFAQCNTNQFAPGTNVSFSTNGGTITIQVPAQSFLTNGLVTAAITNGFLTTNQAALFYYPTSNPSQFSTLTQVTNLTLAQGGLLSNYIAGFATTNQLTFGTNIIYTNLLSALQLTNAALAASIANSSNSAIAYSSAISNQLFTTKQPASTTLSNLSGTGAFTNTISAGTNITLVTNAYGVNVQINAQSQTWLTNGLVQWTGIQPGAFIGTNYLPGITNGFVDKNVTNGLLGAATAVLLYYPTSNPSGFISSVPSGLATTNFVVAYSDTNGSARAAVSAAATAYQPASMVLTNLAATGANTNQYMPGAGVSFSTNYYGVTINATNQSYSTNGLAGTNYVNMTTQGMLTNNYTGTFVRLNGGLEVYGDMTLPDAGVFYTAGAFQGGNFAGGSFTGDGSGLTNINLTTLNYNNITNAPNLSGYQLTTNGLAQGWFGFGTKTNFLITTNVIGLIGNCAGTYVFNGTIWTNPFSVVQISQVGSLYYAQSNSTSLYQSSDIVNWDPISGASPGPVGAWGTAWHMNGVEVNGFVVSTNIYWQITNAIATLSPGAQSTNFSLSGVVAGWTTNTIFSTSGSNIITSIATAAAIAAGGPTNGITASAVTNIVTSMTNGLAPITYVQAATNGFVTQAITNGLAAIAYVNSSTNGFVDKSITNNFAPISYVTNRGAVQWGTVSNLTVATRPATLYYYFTNGIPQYGTINTN